jgi:hypothetical protein
MYLNMIDTIKCIYRSLFIYICIIIGKGCCLLHKKNSDNLFYEEKNHELIKNPDYIDELESYSLKDLDKCFYCKNKISCYNQTFRMDDKSYCSIYCRNSSSDLSKYIIKK